MKANRILVLCSLLVSSVACEKELDVALPPFTPKLVIDGWIEQNQYPTVILTRNAGYFDGVDSSSIRDLVVTTAKVSISDGEREEVLTLRRRDAYFPNFLYQGTDIRGEVGRTYRLTVTSEGKTYTATTTIPAPVPLDSVWYDPRSPTDTLGYVRAGLTDPAAEANYYRLFTQRVGKDDAFVPVYLSAISDQYFNGQSLSFSVLRGANSLSNITDDLYFERDDTIRVKMCTIDRVHYDFWRTLERELYATGNPFASSGNEVLSNIEGGALGVWGGYGASYHVLRAQ